jgi:hypothetical protein
VKIVLAGYGHGSILSGREVNQSSPAGEGPAPHGMAEANTTCGNRPAAVRAAPDLQRRRNVTEFTPDG